MEEIWRDIKGYEGYYKVSNLGRIYSYPRPRTKGGFTYGNKNGDYLKFCLSVNGRKIDKGVHYFVYEAFKGEIPKGYDVHHKNHIRTDNRIENLEIIKESEHQKLHYAENKERLIESQIAKTSKPVLQYTLDGQFVAEYQSINEASRISGVDLRNIQKVLQNKPHRKTAGGFIWKFKNITDTLAA